VRGFEPRDAPRSEAIEVSTSTSKIEAAPIL